MPCRSTCKKVKDKAERDALLSYLQQRGLSQREACHYLGLNRATVRYVPRPDHNAALLAVMTAYAQKRRRRGYRKAHEAVQRSRSKPSLNRIIVSGNVPSCG